MTATAMTATLGTRVPRIEDPALLRGAGRFVDDLRFPGALHAAFVRSPYAHARVLSVDVTDASTLPGVTAVLTAAELAPLLTDLRLPIAFPEGQLPPDVMPFALVRDEALHVGEPVAIVVASSRRVAEDAAERVVVEYDPLPAVTDPRAALDAGAEHACSTADGNLFKRFRVAFGDVDAAFAGAQAVVAERFRLHRGGGSPMETRGVVARHCSASGELTVWSSTQMPHELRHTLAERLSLPEDRVRVVTPDVGGGFGTKYLVYPEEVAVAAAAKALDATVTWTEDRQEHFVSAIQERDQHWSVEMALDGDGRLLAVRGTLVHDQGAYAPHSVNVPFNSATSLPGPYVLPAYDLDVAVVRTNLVPVIPVRGAGYPQGCFVMERLMDRAAERLGLDRADIRRRNLIGPDRMPYPTPMRTRAGAPIAYDSGDYPACQAMGLEAIGYGGFRARQAAARVAGRHIGIGIANAVKGTGRGPFESGLVRVMPDGRVSVYTGALAMGQGLKTALAQIAADTLGVPVERVDVIAGDTGFVSLGHGGYASRQTVTAGSSVLMAARAVREKALAVASGLLEAATADLVIRDGMVQVDGVPGMAVPLARIASMLRGLPGYAFPEGVSAGLEAVEHARFDQLAYANAFHACEVEVDVETGGVRVLRYLAVTDCGRRINPLIVDGQVTGGIVHGIGNALLEEFRHDGQGQPLTTTFADYLLPTAHDAPPIELLYRESPSPLNPLGVKGAGEVGVIPVTAAVVSAVEDALAPFGARFAEAPLSPVRILETLLKPGLRTGEGGTP